MRSHSFPICSASIGFACILATVALSLHINDASAQTSHADELRQSISDRQSEIQKLEDEIAGYQKEIDSLGGEKKTLQNAIKMLDITRSKLNKDIQLTEKKIAQTNTNIALLSQQIDDKEQRIEVSKSAISQIIRSIDASSQSSLVEMLLSANSLSGFLQETDELSRFQENINDNLKTLSRYKDELDQTKNTYESQKKDLSQLSGRLGDQKTLADQERKEQTSLLGQTQQKESNYKTLLDQKMARKKQFELEISDFEAQLKAEIDPNSYPPPGTKVLSFPVVQPFITQKFGKTVDAKRLYVSGTHNGIDLRAGVGTPIMAAADGAVVGTGDTDKTCRWASYGKWILIRHQNGLSTLYGHLSLIKVASGQSVSRGDLIGYSGQTGYATGPHLHFTVLVSSAASIDDIPSKSCPGAIFHMPAAPPNAYLDPEAYL